MARVRIVKPNGKPSPYFWSDQESGDESHRTVFKRTEEGVKRMKGVHFDAVRNKLRKD
jgi:hypothetical protein